MRRTAPPLADEIRKRVVDDQLYDDMAGGMVGLQDAPASSYAAGERGQQAVEIAEKMRTAARLAELEDDMRTTQITRSLAGGEPDSASLVPPASFPASRFDGSLASAAEQTVDWEARKDKQGNLVVYELPTGDDGGSYEVAGINNRFHPQAAEELKNMEPGLRRGYAASYIGRYTAPLTDKLPEAYRPFFQDMAFNRGLTGATKFLQRALGVRDDGVLGPKTLAVLQNENPRDVMRQTSLEQLEYERRLARQNPQRKKFLPGLESRIRNRLATFG
jgi:hypothetical protein